MNCGNQHSQSRQEHKNGKKSVRNCGLEMSSRYHKQNPNKVSHSRIRGTEIYTKQNSENTLLCVQGFGEELGIKCSEEGRLPKAKQKWGNQPL